MTCSRAGTTQPVTYNTTAYTKMHNSTRGRGAAVNEQREQWEAVGRGSGEHEPGGVAAVRGGHAVAVLDMVGGGVMAVAALFSRHAAEGPAAWVRDVPPTRHGGALSCASAVVTYRCILHEPYRRSGCGPGQRKVRVRNRETEHQSLANQIKAGTCWQPETGVQASLKFGNVESIAKFEKHRDTNTVVNKRQGTPVPTDTYIKEGDTFRAKAAHSEHVQRALAFFEMCRATRPILEVNMCQLFPSHLFLFPPPLPLEPPVPRIKNARQNVRRWAPSKHTRTDQKFLDSLSAHESRSDGFPDYPSVQSKRKYVLYAGNPATEWGSTPIPSSCTMHFVQD
ncbi:hypothetical protein B0H10DRAFT_1961856 [Mycena sp. CBHHK59/15]|nr:hypothetical protein B0H10DRAFT_1961856 [Mycena sp. CBHHK59/15]